MGCLVNVAGGRASVLSYILDEFHSPCRVPHLAAGHQQPRDCLPVTVTPMTVPMMTSSTQSSPS